MLSDGMTGINILITCYEITHVFADSYRGCRWNGDACSQGIISNNIDPMYVQ